MDYPFDPTPLLVPFLIVLFVGLDLLAISLCCGMLYLCARLIIGLRRHLGRRRLSHGDSPSCRR